MKTLALRAGGVLAALATLLALWACLKNMAMMQGSSGWTKTTGTITASHLQDNSVGRKERFKARLAYSYASGAGRHTSTRVRFADTAGSARTTQQAILDKYPLGSTVDVYYDPADPTQAVLEPGGGARRFTLLIPPLLLAGLAAWLLIAGFKR